MNFKLKPLSLAAIATATVLSGCGTEEENIEKTVVFDEATKTGLWCKLPDIVQTVDADFHPLSETEIESLQAKALEMTYPDGATEDQETDFAASFNPYEFDFSEVDLYPVLGLTMEEKARQVIAKAEAREFKVSQKQDVIFGDGFDEWFDAWFATVPETDYLGKSQRLAKAKLGMELSLSAANNGEEACYTPPTECPNYKVLDESGTYDCIVPEENPLAAEQPAIPADALAASGEGKAVIFFRKNGPQTAANYENITIHTWNNANCTAYNEDTSVTNWGSGKAAAVDKPDANYGLYWILDLVDEPSACGNMIVYNKSTGDKFISQNDMMIPLGNSGDIVFQNPDKISFFQEGIAANLMDGAYLANQHPLLGASTGSKSCGWGTTLDEAGEACVGQEIPNCPEGTYAVGVGQVDVASKCVAEFDPETTTFLLRGGFNGWGNPTDGTEFEKVADGQYRKLFEYGAHPADVPLEFAPDASVEVETAAGATLTFVQPTDDEGNNVDFELDLNNIPADTVFMMADGTEVTLAADGNVLTLPEGEEAPAVEELSIAIPAGSMLTLAAGANHADFACTEDCLTSYNFKIADADWSEAATYGGIKGGDALVVGGDAKALTAGENVGQDIGIKMQDTSVYQFVFTAEQANNASIEVDQVPVMAFPNIVIDGTATAMSYKGDNQYVLVQQELAAGTYAISFADEANAFAYGAGTDSAADVNEVVTLAADGGAVTLTVTDAQKYDFVLDFSDLEAPTFKAQPSKPLGSNQTFIRGSINGWGTPETDEIMFDEATNTYSIIFGLEAAEQAHEFKFATADWSAVNMGYNEVTPSTDADALPLVDKGGNIGVVVDETMSYKFELIYNAAKPTLKVSKLPIYIRGGMNGWGEVDKLAFNAVDAGEAREAGHEYVSSIALGADNVFFKVATSDWSTVNLGSATDGPEAMSLNTPLVLGGANDNNLSFDPAAAATFKFIFNEKTKTLTITE